MRRRPLALLLAAALGCVASAPCPRALEARLPSAHARAESPAHGHPEPSDAAPAAPTDAHAHHAHHSAHRAPERAADAAAATALSAPCPCGCGDDAAPGASGARLGHALRRAPPDPLACPPRAPAAAEHPELPEAPLDARDPVPI